MAAARPDGSRRGKRQARSGRLAGAGAQRLGCDAGHAGRRNSDLSITYRIHNYRIAVGPPQGRKVFTLGNRAGAWTTDWRPRKAAARGTD